MNERMNERMNKYMYGALGHPYVHTGKTGPGEPPEDTEMNQMTLPSRHRIQKSSPCCQRPSTLPLGHRGFPQYGIVTSRSQRLSTIRNRYE